MALRLNVAAAFALMESKQPFPRASSAEVATIFIASQHFLRWQDLALGWQEQDLAHEVGDFVLRHSDGLWAYQLAVVVDDAAQGVTHVVRGQDLADNTPRQILLQNALGLPTPHYRHTPLVRAPNGEKLSKQNGAQALDLSDPARALLIPLRGKRAACHLMQMRHKWRSSFFSPCPGNSPALSRLGDSPVTATTALRLFRFAE